MISFIKDIILSLKDTFLYVVYILNFITLGTIFYLILDSSSYKIISDYPLIENNSFIYLCILLCMNIILFTKQLNNLVFRLLALPFTTGIFIVFKLFYIEYNKLDTLNITYWVGIKRIWSFSELEIELEKLTLANNINLSDSEKIIAINSNNTMSSLHSYVQNLKLEKTQLYEKLLNDRLLDATQNISNSSSFSIVQHITENSTLYAISSLVFVTACVGIYFYMSGGSSPANDPSLNNNISNLELDMSRIVNVELEKRVSNVETILEKACIALTNQHKFAVAQLSRLNDTITFTKEELKDRVVDLNTKVDDIDISVNALLTTVNTDTTRGVFSQNEMKQFYEGKLNTLANGITEDLNLMDKKILEISRSAEDINVIKEEIVVMDENITSLFDSANELRKVVQDRMSFTEKGITAFLVYLSTQGIIPADAASFSDFAMGASKVELEDPNILSNVLSPSNDAILPNVASPSSDVNN